MKVSVTTLPLRELDVDLLIVPVAEDAPEAHTSHLIDVLGSEVERALADVGGKKDDDALVYPAEARAKRVLLVGLGKAADADAERVRQAAATGASVAQKRETTTVGFVVPDLPLDGEATGQALVEGFSLGGYRFRQYKTDAQGAFDGPQRLVLHADAKERGARRGAERGRVVAEAVNAARDLVNLSPDDKTPTLFAKAVEKSGKRYGYEASVWNKTLIEEEKMGGLLAVNRGSQDPPVFIEMTWKPEHAVNEKPIVLVGKGVMFDTGGLSLKPTKNSMDLMKADMAGAAAVVGAFEAIAKLNLQLHVIGLIPATDNRPGENAYVPGDVLHMHSGATVEVLNTDAEGRLILADALSYAKTYRPELVLDLATLTGAQVVALGSNVAALMTNRRNDPEARLEALREAGQRSGDRVHPLPLDDDFKEQLESDVADLKNVGGKEAGCITAGKFLEHFVSYPWAHLDIAGPAFLQSAKPYRPKGGTGFGVRLLVEFLRDRADPRTQS